MKINEVITEGVLTNLKPAGKISPVPPNRLATGVGALAKGFGALAKGVTKAIAPQTVQTYQQQKNALRSPQTAGDPAMAAYNKFADIMAQRASSGTQMTDQYIASQFPKTWDQKYRGEMLQYVIDRLKRSGVNVMQKPQTSMPMGLKRLTPVQPPPPAATATPVPTTSAPTQPTAQASQDATKAALASRRAAGLGAYESLDYATFKQRLQEAKTQ
jgi:X-X-X-Leu-X-X-Gly heptad repeat protein